MALPDELVLQVGTQIVFADHAGDFSPAAKTSLVQGTPLNVQLSLASLADGAAQESAKFDFGDDRSAAYSVMAAFEFGAISPTSGLVIELYLAPSPDSVPANGNPMQIDGLDAAAPSGIGTRAELLKACFPIGNFICTNDIQGTVQVAFISVFTPPEQHGILIVNNECGEAFDTDDIQCHVVFNRIIERVVD